MVFPISVSAAARASSEKAPCPMVDTLASRRSRRVGYRLPRRAAKVWASRAASMTSAEEVRLPAFRWAAASRVR